MPLYKTSKNRLWPNVWKGIGLLLIVLVFVSAGIGKHWQSQGDRLRLLPPSEWGFGVICVDGVNLRTHQGCGGCLYRYGLVEREPKSVIDSCGE